MEEKVGAVIVTFLTLLGIQWKNIDYFNNKIVCDLIEAKRPMGIFVLLDDVSNFPKGTDDKFLMKMNDHLKHEHFLGGHTGEFTVKHYAGDVLPFSPYTISST